MSDAQPQEETRVVPTSLLHAVRKEVEELRDEVAFYRDLAETLEKQRDDLLAAVGAAPSTKAGSGAADGPDGERVEAALVRVYDELAEARDTLDTTDADLQKSRAETVQAEAERDAALQLAADAQAERDTAAGDLARATLDATRARAERDELARTHPLPARLRRRLNDGSSPDPHEAVAAAFVGWCQRDSPLRSRPYLFESFVREAARLPDARVTPLFRTADGLRADGGGTAGAAEYWLVRADGLSIVVPQPARADAFAELHADVVGGAATPDTLAGIVPAEARLDGLDADVVRVGTVTAAP